MIAQRYRFRKPKEMRPLFRYGQVEKTPYFRVRHCSNRRQDYRLAIIVSKKIDKKAVVRNRIRRRFYELWRQRLSTLDISADIAIIVLDREALNLSWMELQELLEPIWRKLKEKYANKSMNY